MKKISFYHFLETPARRKIYAFCQIAEYIFNKVIASYFEYSKHSKYKDEKPSVKNVKNETKIQDQRLYFEDVNNTRSGLYTKI